MNSLGAFEYTRRCELPRASRHATRWYITLKKALSASGTQKKACGDSKTFTDVLIADLKQFCNELSSKNINETQELLKML